MRRERHHTEPDALLDSENPGLWCDILVLPAVVLVAVRTQLVKSVQQAAKQEVGGDDAEPDVLVQYYQELEEFVVKLGLLQKDGQPHQVVVRHGEVNHVLSLRHHRNGAYCYVSSLRKHRRQSNFFDSVKLIMLHTYVYNRGVAFFLVFNQSPSRKNKILRRN